jgi:hypothetical protein
MTTIALMEAANNGHTRVLKLLIAAGADVTAQEDGGKYDARRITQRLHVCRIVLSQLVVRQHDRAHVCGVFRP